MLDITRDDDATILRLAGQGLSPMRIAVELGGAWSRNTVAARLEAIKKAIKDGVAPGVVTSVPKSPAVAVEARKPVAPSDARAVPKPAETDRMFINRPWTPEEDALVKALWKTNSAKSIAMQFPGRSKNAVIGRLHRLGIKGDQKSELSSHTGKIAASRPDAKRSSPRARLPHNFFEPKKFASQVSNVAALVIAGPYEPRRVPLVNLRDQGECRFIVNGYLSGDPVYAPALYCGLATPEKSPYCGHHLKTMYVPREQRKKKPEPQPLNPNQGKR